MINKAAAIIIKERSVLYLKEKDFPYWILPGGTIEGGESPEQTLEREMMEELSIRIKIVEDLGVINGEAINGKTKELTPMQLHIYKVELLDEIEFDNEILAMTYIKNSNVQEYEMTPIGIQTVEYLHNKGLIE